MPILPISIAIADQATSQAAIDDLPRWAHTTDGDHRQKVKKTLTFTYKPLSRFGSSFGDQTAIILALSTHKT